MMDTVVVTASKITRKPQTGDVDLETSPISVSIIRREDFEAKTESVAEVVEKEVGVQVRQSGGLGSFSSVSLRGSSSEQVMVFMDGILLNDASGGGVDLSTIALSDVEAIEVFRGATPVNFGKQSIGGAVNIRTRRSQKGLAAKASVGYGSFNTRKIAAFVNYKPDKRDCLISADYLSSDNDFEFLNGNGTQWNTADDRWELRNNAQVRQYNILGKAGYDFSETLRLDVLNQLFDKRQGLPSWNNSPLARATLETTRNLSALRLTADDLTPLHLNSRTLVSYTWKQEEYDDRGGHIGLGDQHTTYTTRRLGVDIYGEWLTDSQAAILTIGGSTESYETEDHLDRQNPRDSRRGTVSAGVQDSLFVLNQNLIVTPAVRYTWIRDELKSGESIWGTSLESRTRSDDYLCPQIGARYRAFPWLGLKSNLARYVREPSFFELFGDRGFVIGNPDLEEEKGVNFDIGAEVMLAPGRGDQKVLQRARAAATYFRSDVDDLIARAYDARGIGKSVNVEGALIQGVEFSLSAELLSHFNVLLNYTWQEPKNESRIKAFKGKMLPGRFEKALLGRLEVRHSSLKVYLEYIQEKEMYYDTANLLKADDKEEINAGISWLWRSVTVSLEGRNLGDEMYEDFNGYPQPGRSFSASISYAFNRPF